MRRGLMIFLISLTSAAWSQDQLDSIQTRRLEEVVIKGQQEINVERLPEIAGTRIWSGKKNEVLNVTNLDANIAEKTARQVFAKVPGVFVYDMDGTGNQINIATRGLDPHRGWEFNIRRNDAITNSDMYGYPPVITVCPWRPWHASNWCGEPDRCSTARSLVECSIIFRSQRTQPARSDLKV